MFDRMQYVMEPPLCAKGDWSIRITDFDGVGLGSAERNRRVSTMFRLLSPKGELMASTTPTGMLSKDVMIQGPMGEVRGKIATPIAVRSGITSTTVDEGMFLLFDAMGQHVASSSRLTINYNLNKVSFRSYQQDTARLKYEQIGKNGFWVFSLKGETAAAVSAAKGRDGLQLDIYSSSIDRLLILSLVIFAIT